MKIMGTSTVSCRGKPSDMTMEDWLLQYSKYAPLKITGVFGFLEESSPLYGGRVYVGAEITKKDAQFLKDNDLQLKINLTGNNATEKEYEESRELLNTYYYQNNVVSVIDDNLASWIKRDYPNYIVEASVIKKIGFDKIDKILETYDQMVLPIALNDDIENLKKIKQKDKIILFANAGCGYTCKHQICYSSVSKINKGEIPLEEYKCSKDLKPREIFTLHDFELNKLKELGFHNFKYLTVAKGRAY